MTVEIEALTARLERLERVNRRLKLMGVGIVLASMASCSTGLTGKPRTLEAEEIVIRDSHGRARVMIGTPEFLGAAFGMKPDQPAIWLSDENGQDRSVLTTDGLYLADSHSKPLVEITTDSSGPALRFHDPDGKVTWSAP